MSHKDTTYVIFDGDKDGWAYSFMRGWKANERVDFDFIDAHDLDNMTSRAQGEQYVKGHLRQRMAKASAVLVIVGESTKNLYRFVRWELELALSQGLPLIVANRNEKRAIDRDLCPPILRDECVLHIPFKLKAIKYALDTWPSQVGRLDTNEKRLGPRYYSQEIYKSMGL